VKGEPRQAEETERDMYLWIWKEPAEEEAEENMMGS
jgi:hypothetical protein